MADPKTEAGGSLDERLERLQSRLERFRRELIYWRTMAFGCLAVGLLGAFEARRIIVGGALLLVLLIVFFISCRLGIGGHAEMTLGESIGLTLALALAYLLLVLWRGA